MERQVWHGVDSNTDYTEVVAFPADEGLTPGLVPFTELGGELCVYYSFETKDGVRMDRITDFRTGEIIDSQ